MIPREELRGCRRGSYRGVGRDAVGGFPHKYQPRAVYHRPTTPYTPPPGLPAQPRSRSSIMAGKSKQGARTHEFAPSEDAIEMLVTDHRKVKELFSEFDTLKKEDDDGSKAELVSQICKELTIHAAIEEEI